MFTNQTFFRQPVFRLLLPLMIGIVFQYFCNQPLVFYTGFILSALFFVFYLFIGKDSFDNRWLLGVAVMFFCFAGGGCLMHRAWQKTDWPVVSEAAKYYGTLTDYPSEKNKTVSCKIQLHALSDEGEITESDKNVIVYLPKDSASLALLPGDRIVFCCKFEALSPDIGEGGSGYDLYLKKQGYAAKGFVRKNQWKYVNHQSGLGLLALECGRHLSEKMKSLGLSERSYALAVAILLGYKDLIDSDLKTDFANSGISHLIAVSGMHTQYIFILFAFLLGFMGKGKRSRAIRLLVVLFLVWVFTYITALAPSMVRAAAMLTCYGVGELLGRKSDTLNAVFISAGMMLLYNPLYLFDVSFQLSYAAVLSIITIYPLMEKWHETKNPIVRYLWASLCISVAAQLATTPMCLYYFHQFPTYFWITNMLAVPVSGFLLVGLIAATAIQWVVSLPAYVYLPIEYALRYTVKVAEAVSQMPFSVIRDIHINEIQTCLLYGMIFCLGMFFKDRRAVYVYLFQLFLLLQVISYL